MVLWFLRLYSRLPLPLIHVLGVIVGIAMFLGSRKFAGHLRRNLATAGLTHTPQALRRLLWRNIVETGKHTLETLAIWFAPEQRVLSWVRECRGWPHVEDALQRGRGIIFLTPHLGCFEITALYYAARHPISVLYRPPRKAWLAPLVHTGRSRGQVKLAPTNLRGVRGLFNALKQNEAIGILPDQVPGRGEGEWASFLGRPAYTMTLVGRLAEATQAPVLLAFGERLSWGRGYVIHIQPFTETPTPLALNAAIEQLVRQRPEQYLWSYQRHKIPHGVAPP